MKGYIISLNIAVTNFKSLFEELLELFLFKINYYGFSSSLFKRFSFCSYNLLLV